MDIKKLAEAVNAKVEVQADSWLDKLKAFKWTGAVLVGAFILVLVAL